MRTDYSSRAAAVTAGAAQREKDGTCWADILALVDVKKMRASPSGVLEPSRDGREDVHARLLSAFRSTVLESGAGHTLVLKGKEAARAFRRELLAGADVVEVDVSDVVAAVGAARETSSERFFREIWLDMEISSRHDRRTSRSRAGTARSRAET